MDEKDRGLVDPISMLSFFFVFVLGRFCADIWDLGLISDFTWGAASGVVVVGCWLILSDIMNSATPGKSTSPSS